MDTPRSKGNPVSGLSARLPLVVGFLTLLVLVLGFGLWAGTQKIAGAVVAGGRIEVEQNRQIVQHPDGGVVGEILVKEGDSVAAGQALIRLDATALKSELAITESQLFELMARRGRLEAEQLDAETVAFDNELVAAAASRAQLQNLLDGQRQLFAARLASLTGERDQLDERKRQIGAQIAGIEAQRAALSTQMDLVESDLASVKTLLQKELAEASRVTALQREQARLLGEHGDLTASIAEQQGRLTEIDIQILKLATTRREEAIAQLRDLQYQEFNLQEKRLELRERISRLDITAPTAGIVYGLQVHALRAVVQAAEPILHIVPQDRPLVIAARIDPVHIDQVHTGQDVTLRFSSFDLRQTPEVRGTVLQVSADAFVDQQTGASFYRAEIAPLAEDLANLPGLALVPGMPVEAFLKTGERTVIAYLIKPLADYFAKAFREG